MFAHRHESLNKQQQFNTWTRQSSVGAANQKIARQSQLKFQFSSSNSRQKATLMKSSNLLNSIIYLSGGFKRRPWPSRSLPALIIRHLS